jgi:serine/threonine-protein kinase RsbW
LFFDKTKRLTDNWKAKQPIIWDVNSPLQIYCKGFLKRYNFMTSRTPSPCSLVVESKLSVISGVYAQILTELEANSYGPDDIFSVHLTLEEAFVNAVKHGNKGDPTKKITVEYSVCSDKVELVVADEGVGFDPGVVPDPRIGENLYKANGRGLLLMRSYMDVVKFNKQGNRVHMVRYKDKKRRKTGA